MKGFLRIVLGLSLIGILCSINSCGENFLGDPCIDCFREKPTEGILTVKVNPSDRYTLVGIRIIQGRLEKGIEYLKDTIQSESADYWVDVNNYYTVEAHYLVDQVHYKVVDGDRVSIYFDAESCDEPCWRPNDGEVNCKLEL